MKNFFAFSFIEFIISYGRRYIQIECLLNKVIIHMNEEEQQQQRPIKKSILRNWTASCCGMYLFLCLFTANKIEKSVSHPMYIGSIHFSLFLFALALALSLSLLSISQFYDYYGENGIPANGGHIVNRAKLWYYFMKINIIKMICVHWMCACIPNNKANELINICRSMYVKWSEECLCMCFCM